MIVNMIMEKNMKTNKTESDPTGVAKFNTTGATEAALAVSRCSSPQGEGPLLE